MVLLRAGAHLVGVRWCSSRQQISTKSGRILPIFFAFHHRLPHGLFPSFTWICLLIAPTAIFVLNLDSQVANRLAPPKTPWSYAWVTNIDWVEKLAQDHLETFTWGPIYQLLRKVWYFLLIKESWFTIQYVGQIHVAKITSSYQISIFNLIFR